MDDILLASTQTSRSSAPARHCDSAKKAASWVLPLQRSQSCDDPAPTRLPRGASMTAPVRPSASLRSGPVSGRVLNLSASAGTEPDRAGHWADACKEV